MGSTHPVIHTRTTKEHLSHGVVFQGVKAVLPPSLSPSLLVTSPLLWCSATQQRGKGVALMLPEVLNHPTCDCYFHPSTPLSVSAARRELAAGFDQVGKLFH